MTFEEAIKKAIKVYFEADEEELDKSTIQPKKYTRKYFEEQEEEFLGKKTKKDKKDGD